MPYYGMPQEAKKSSSICDATILGGPEAYAACEASLIGLSAAPYFIILVSITSTFVIILIISLIAAISRSLTPEQTLVVDAGVVGAGMIVAGAAMALKEPFIGIASMAIGSVIVGASLIGDFTLGSIS
jgi:hypothetical protein